MLILIGIAGYLLIGLILNILTGVESWAFPVTIPFWIVYVSYNTIEIFHDYLWEKHREKDDY
jgi:hypothetical protein